VFLWALAAAVGLVALLSVIPATLTLIRIVGAAYLTYLGVQAWRSTGTAAPLPARRGSAFRDGLLCNVLNPKAAVFFVALLPQFLPARPGPLDVLLLSTMTVAITLAWFGAVAQVVSLFRRVLSRPRVRRTIDAVSGTVLIALGARLALNTAR
jgi:threonine/homoserine/homoserine lactone efflux protein